MEKNTARLVGIPSLEELMNKAFKGYENTSENWVLSITALSGAFNGTTRTYLDGMQDEDWWENDGALNTISMTHPRLPIEHPNQLVLKDSDYHPMHPGIWYYKLVEGDHILFIINKERAGVQFDLIYDSIFERYRKHAFRKNNLHMLPNDIHQ